MRKNARIYIAGHAGLIGSAVVRYLSGYGYENLITRRRDALDLTNAESVERFFEHSRPEYVVLAAGKVGGITENQMYPAEFMHENLAIQINTLRAAQRTEVKRLIFIGSSCMYPRECPQPMPEALLLSGKPEPTSLAYAISKLAGVQMCLSYNQQYGAQRFIPIIPNTAYGPNDNFNPHSGHVLSSLIHKFHDAKLNRQPVVRLWGSGNPRREFVHADDIADVCHWLLCCDLPNLELPLNVGVGCDYSIRELADQIAAIVGYSGTIEWDTSRPDGAPRKLLDSTRLGGYGWKPRIDFAKGLRETYEWYLRHLTEKATA